MPSAAGAPAPSVPAASDPIPGASAAPPPGTDHPVPWGMQIAVRYDKVHPPRRIDVAEAAARAVVSLLAAPESAPGGPWHDDVAHWRDGRIRKLVRRARGKRWEEIGQLPGITVAQEGPLGWGTAAARAFVPGPVRPLPGVLAKTQVEGTHFPSGEDLPPPPAAVTAGLADPAQAAGVIDLGAQSATADALVTIEVTPWHEMSSGKLAAQCAHAAQLAWESPDMGEGLRRAWERDGFRVRVVRPSREQWEAVSRPVTVTDAGYTELDGPTLTTRAYW